MRKSNAGSSCCNLQHTNLWLCAGEKKWMWTIAAKHIKSIMKQNQFDKVVVKLFHDYKAFLTRAEGMNNIASVEQQDTRKHEEMIKGLLLDISL